MSKIVFSMSEGQAEHYPDWESRKLTVETPGSVHLAFGFLQDEHSNPIARLHGSLWIADADGPDYSDVAIVADDGTVTPLPSSDLARGFVVGDWNYKPDGGLAIRPYPARLGALWNGFESPYFDRSTADRVMADQQSLIESLDPEERVGLYTFAWDGETILIDTVMPRPGTASAEDAEQPGRLEAIDIDGVPHWNLALGWTWQQVTEDGEAVSNDTTAAQRDAYMAGETVLGKARESLQLERGLRRRQQDGTDVIPVTAHLGAYDAQIPAHVTVGALVIARDGAATLALQYTLKLGASPSEATPS